MEALVNILDANNDKVLNIISDVLNDCERHEIEKYKALQGIIVDCKELIRFLAPSDSKFKTNVTMIALKYASILGFITRNKTDNHMSLIKKNIESAWQNSMNILKSN